MKFSDAENMQYLLDALALKQKWETGKSSEEVFDRLEEIAEQLYFNLTGRKILSSKDGSDESSSKNSGNK